MNNPVFLFYLYLLILLVQIQHVLSKYVIDNYFFRYAIVSHNTLPWIINKY